jgi:hypothetical protein
MKNSKVDYELTPVKTGNVHKQARKAYQREVAYQNTWFTLWLLLCKHKVGVLITMNVLWVLNWALPAWPQMVASVL